MSAPTRTNERPGTRAALRHVRVSAPKARAVLDLIRGQEVGRADETLRFCEREAAAVVRKLLRSAVANAEHNDDQIPDDLFVASCFADEGRSLPRRFRPRARGRATRIRKRTSHITIIVSRLPEDALARREAREAARPGTRAARRAGQRAAEEGGRTRRRRRGGRGAETQAAGEEEVSPVEDEGSAPEEEAPVPEPEAEPPEAEEVAAAPEPADAATHQEDEPEEGQ